MRGKKDHAFAAGFGLGEVLETLVDGDRAYILFGVSRKEAELCHKPSQVHVDAAEDSLFFFSALGWKSKVQVAPAYAAQAGISEIDKQAQGDAKASGQRSRQRANQGRQHPYRKILKPISHSRETLDGNIGAGIIQIRTRQPFAAFPRSLVLSEWLRHVRRCLL
jgi:hypothetical protein